MKGFIITLFIFLTDMGYGIPQDSAITISAKPLDNNEQILLSAIDGWLFKPGNDPSWASNEINTSGWTRLKPTELSVEHADKNGKVEGWFRIKLKLDKDFSNTALGIVRGGWAASDIYIDGNFFASFGKTGTENNSYQEYNPI